MGEGWLKANGSRMHLTALQKSRRAPEPGDIFAMLPPDGRYLFGRVISTDSAGPMGVGCVLVYIYAIRSDTKNVVPDLLRGQLLVPPLMTNKLPWSKGYFEHVEHRTLTPMDRLPQHCFRDTRDWYFDEHGNRLDEPTSPVGSWGLDSFRTIDDEVSRALGIPLAP
jgi:immunity protein 26 of polymorphic toxin system